MASNGAFLSVLTSAVPDAITGHVTISGARTSIKFGVSEELAKLLVDCALVVIVCAEDCTGYGSGFGCLNKTRHMDPLSIKRSRN